MRTRAVTASLVAAATLTALAVLSPAPALAQPEGAYQLPPKVVVDILDARPLPTVAVSPTGQQMALLERASMPSIAEMAAPIHRLGGLRINPATNGPQRGGGILAITLKPIAPGKEVKVRLPLEPNVTWTGFSADGKRFAFTQTTATGIALWVGSAATGVASAVTAPTLNATFGQPCQWVSATELLCRFVPAARGPAPKAPAVPSGPNVQENAGKAAPAATYQDLLKSAHDERLYEYYFTSQLAFVNAATGARTSIGKPGLFEEVSVSPDGGFLLVARQKRPFSRLIPADGFAKEVEVWTRGGQVVKRVADLPVAEQVPIGGVPTGPRSWRWHPVDPATVLWVEALDGGDLKNKVPRRDRLVALERPFTGEPSEVAALEHRFQGMWWTEGGLGLVGEFDRATRRRRTWLVAPGTSPRKVWELSSEERYLDPGTPVMRTKVGEPVVQQAGDFIYLRGAGASPKGDFPFLDRFNLKTLTAERIFRCEGENYETVTAILTPDARSILTRYETRREPPNYYLRNLTDGSRRALTAVANPAPQLDGVTRQVITYTRKDGVALNGTLYLPPGYKPGERLPLVMWAYPREFTDAAAAGQITGSQFTFTTVSGASHMLFLTQGYAVLDDPKMPIIGPGETANDSYVEQLVASAEAAVDKVVEMGVADRHRIGVGGHSYGAFMTANLLAHSRLFRAGIARSGAYNRTLTPFGFQSEQRTFWEIPDIYGRMSPFFHADAVKDPILLVHGEADNNSGTFPIQSERFYMALKGLGATVRYVTLPHESHGYAARESNLHTLFEMISWFDKWVKNAGPRQ